MAQTGTDRKPLKERIHSNEEILGIWMPVTADRDGVRAALERDSYDFVWTDAQHAPFNEERLTAFCSTVGEFGQEVIFRIKHGRQAFLIGNYLDLGVAGIEVPQVDLESTVDEAVSNFYYSPVGVRSWGGTARVGLDGRSDRLEYAKWWNEHGVLWVQLESIQAVTGVRKLAKPGVDCLSFGPNDLLFSLEAHPGHPFKTVDECLAHVIEQTRDMDVAVLFRIQTPDERRKYRDMGATVLLERL